MNISRRSFFALSAAAVVAPIQMLEAGGFKEAPPKPAFSSGKVLTAEKLNREFNKIYEWRYLTDTNNWFIRAAP